MFTSILCPVDFSEHAERALQYAFRLAELTGARLTIMTATDPFLGAASSAAGHREVLTQQTQEEMQGLLARFGEVRDRLKHPPAIAVVNGDPGEQILKQIRECDADVVVMGTQGLDGAKRLVFGSTTEHVLREARVPVLAVPPPDNASGG